jgi:hypothetical protein
MTRLDAIRAAAELTWTREEEFESRSLVYKLRVPDEWRMNHTLTRLAIWWTVTKFLWRDWRTQQ